MKFEISPVGLAAEASAITIELGYALTYNTQEQTQTVESVMAAGLTLAEDDYSIAGNAGTNAGDYSLTVTAKDGGNFTGSATKEFSIAKLSLKDAAIELDKTKLTYNQVKQTQMVVAVKVGEVALPASDYAVSGNEQTNAGACDLTVTGQTNCVDSASIKFTIEQLDISNATVTTTKDLTYNRSKQTQSVAGVVVGELTLTTDEYEVTGITAVTDAGDYTLYVTGKGNYIGKANADFKVFPLDLTAAGAEVVLGSGLTYNGTEQTQTVNKVIDANDNVLSDSAEYELSGNKGTNAGSYTLEVTGKGNYTSSVTKDFNIDQAMPTYTLDDTLVGEFNKTLSTVPLPAPLSTDTQGLFFGMLTRQS